MTKASLLCLSSTFWDDPATTSTQAARHLARHYEVLFVEPSPAQIYLREPSRNRRWLRSGRLWQAASSLHVYSPPPTLPFKSRVPAVNALGQRWVRPFIGRAIRALGLDRPILLTFVPHVYPIATTFSAPLTCYYCVDDMGALSRVVSASVVAGYERRLLERMDLVLTTGVGMKARFSSGHRAVHHMPNGTDPDLYARALDAATPVAQPIRDLDGPVLGFSGACDFRIDQPLVAEVARRRPHWSFVFVGPVRTSVARLRALRNVRFVPRQPLEALPGFLKGFSVGLIPYVTTGMGASITPTKLYDYLAAGLPVVSTPLPELAHAAPGTVLTASTPDGFIDAVERALETRRPEEAVRRAAIARANSWTVRAAAIAALFDAHLAAGRP